MITFFEGLRAVALLVGLGVGIYDKKAAYAADIMFSAWFSMLLYFFPHFITNEIAKNNIGPMEYMVRECGCWLMFPIFMMYMYRKSVDGIIQGPLLWTRTMGTAVLLLMMVYGQVTVEKLNNKTLWSGVFFLGCLCAYNIYQLVSLHPAMGRRETKGPIAFVCRLNFLIYLISGLLCMAFPKAAAALMAFTPKEHDLHFLRCIGALMFAQIFLNWYAPGFRHDKDRKALFSCQLLTLAMMVGAQNYHFFWEKSLPMSVILPFMICNIILGAPALVGLVMITKQEKEAGEKEGFSHYLRHKRSD